jgi:transposase
MICVTLIRPLPVKSVVSEKRRALLTASKPLQENAIAIGNDIRWLPCNFGFKLGTVGVIKLEEWIRSLVRIIAFT